MKRHNESVQFVSQHCTSPKTAMPEDVDLGCAAGLQE
jgi:hypothetical protein